VKDHKISEHHTQKFLFICFETLPHNWLEIYNNKSTALPFENHLQLLIMINKARSLEITIDVSAIKACCNISSKFLVCLSSMYKILPAN